MTMKPSVVPIASGAQSLKLFFEKTAARITSTRQKVPIASMIAPWKLPAEHGR